MTKKEGSVFGGVLLITGSCVGAGMLGLPVLTGLAGLLPAFAMFFCAWLFMTFTGFLLVEINGWFPKQVNLLTMVEHSLGKIGKAFCWMIYLFLFYAILVAYIAASGSLFSSFWLGFTGTSLPSYVGSLILVVLFGGVVYKGTRQVDLWNRCLMVVKILFFFGLVLVGSRYVEPVLLSRIDWSYAPFSLPLLIISFGFHNMIPSLMGYMGGNTKRVRLSILLGGLFAFAIYFVWEILVLGVVPLEGSQGLLEAYRKDWEGAQALSAFVKSPYVGGLAQGLAFFAILTSFLGQSLSFVHFFADGLGLSYKKKESIWLCLLVLLPPLGLSFLYPKLFFQALDFAGGICAVMLFGVMPVLAVWKGRRKASQTGSYRLPGGKIVLIAIFLFALLVFFYELFLINRFIPGI